MGNKFACKFTGVVFQSDLLEKMKQITENSIKALIKLLSDDDSEISNIARSKLIRMGKSVTAFLIKAPEDKDPKIRIRVRAVLEDIKLNDLDTQFKLLSSKSDKEIDLEEGMFLIVRAEYPDVNVRDYKNILNSMADEVDGAIGSCRDPEEIVSILNDYLFFEQGFHGNTTEYYNPDNSYINKVIDNKTGVPITLSSVYLSISKRLNLPIYGIGMPGHFVVKYQSRGYEVFIDPFNSGQLLTETDCTNFLINIGYGVRREYLSKASNREILTRMLRNLINIYSSRGDHTRTRKLKKYLSILNKP